MKGDADPNAADRATPRASRKERYRAMILDAAQQLIDELVDEHQILDLERHLSDRKIAKRAGVSPTTVKAHFTDLYQVCAALKARNRQTDRRVHPIVEHYANLHFTRGPDLETRLAAQLQYKPIPLEAALGLVKQAKARKAAVPIRIQAATAVADAYLRKQTPTHLQDCLKWVRNALQLVDESHIDHIRAALEATDIGAQAARRLSRNDDQETRYLLQVQEYQRTESLYARRLHYLSRAAMAAFHDARAAALLEDDVDSEVAAFDVVAAALKQASDGGEPIAADDIVVLISRVCGVQLAYPERARQLDRARNDIMHLLRSADTRHALRTLMAAVDSHPDYDSETSAIEMMLILRFGTVGYLCVGRILEHKYHRAISEAGAHTQTGVSPPEEELASAFGLPRDISHVLAVNPDEFLVAALSYYTRAQSGTRQSGSAGRLRNLAAEDRERLLSEHAAVRDELETSGIPAMDTDTMAGLTAAIDRLVMRGLVAERADRKQFIKLRRHIDPIYEFLA